MTAPAGHELSRIMKDPTVVTTASVNLGMVENTVKVRDKIILLLYASSWPIPLGCLISNSYLARYAAECRVWSDPWYITFDKVMYANQATCRQILAKTCTNNWPVHIIPTFQIWAEHRKCLGAASCPHSIIIEIYGCIVSLNLDTGVAVMRQIHLLRMYINPSLILLTKIQW